LTTLSSRRFLEASATGVLGLGLGLDRLVFAELRGDSGASAASVAAPQYQNWRDVYKEKWRWDKVTRGSHTNANCVSSCAWNLYVKDGVVWREEQSAPYRASNDSVPDFNPRGCQKGAACSDLLLGPSRIHYPLRRVGPRGAGQWKRIGWDEALHEIAEALVDVLARRGGEGAVLEFGPNVDLGANSASAIRFFHQLGSPITDAMAQIGDLAVGGTITLGCPHVDGTSDDWFRSRYIVLWGFNPSVTRIPDAHFLNEARYGGARVVSITPDYGQSAIHSDLWLGVRPGSDAALALSACRVVIEEGLYDADYVREQTDLPFLVRSDTGRFVRESDLVEGGREDCFAFYDETAGEVVLAPGSMGSAEKSLRIPSGVAPALEGRWQIANHAGSSIEVRTVFSMLRENLAAVEPEQAAKLTGVSAATIRRFAREFAAAPSALILSQWGMCKHYHSDLIQRSQILLASLTGNLGRAGGGWRSGAFLALEGFGLMGMQDQLGLHHLAWTAMRSWWDPKAVMHEFESMYMPSTIFHAVHGGLGEIEGSAAYADPLLPEGAAPYLEEAIRKQRFPVYPSPDDPPPEVIVSMCSNVLRHSRMGERIRDSLFAQAKLIVDVNFRTSETGRHADILLPAAGWYEKVGIKYIASFVPYLTLADRAVAPLGESKPEWEIFSLLAERVGAVARQRGIERTESFKGEDREIGRLGARFSDDGRFGPHDQEAVTEFILSISGPSRGIGLAELRREGGAVRIKGLGPQGGTAGIFSSYDENEPVVPLRDFVEEKQPYPTLTGRQQFYIDHPTFLKLGEALPVHKEPPAAGGDHPFTLTGGHTRWSIHSMWRDQELMLRLQRGEPVVFLNDGDAGRRGIRDHALVDVWNDLARFQARAKLTGAIRPGQVHMYHGWEPYQFRTGTSHQELAPSPFKVTQLVGDYGHLRWSYAHYEPNQVDRDTRVDIAPAES